MDIVLKNSNKIRNVFYAISLGIGVDVKTPFDIIHINKNDDVFIGNGVIQKIILIFNPINSVLIPTKIKLIDYKQVEHTINICDIKILIFNKYFDQKPNWFKLLLIKISGKRKNKIFSNDITKTIVNK
jgi:hypothetical protein